jgi:hypothetical protein
MMTSLDLICSETSAIVSVPVLHESNSSVLHPHSPFEIMSPNGIASVGKASKGAVRITLADGARRPKKLNCETGLA